MKKIVIEITGDSPLLMHNPEQMRRGDQGGKKKIPSPEEEAAASRYLMPDGQTLALHADHLRQCIVGASSGFRIRGRETAVPYISGSLEIVPEVISLEKKDYVIDTRRAVVMRRGILRSRASVFPWTARFELHYDEEVFAESFITGTLRDQIFVKAGKAVGLLDYRPEKRGRFGRFHVTTWDMVQAIGLGERVGMQPKPGGLVPGQAYDVTAQIVKRGRTKGKAR